jgi:hypothetical protein
MQIDITLEPAPSLAEYAGVASAFEVREIFEVAARTAGSVDSCSRRGPWTART